MVHVSQSQYFLKERYHSRPQDEVVDGHFSSTQMNKYYVPIVLFQQSHSPFRVNTRNQSVIKELLEIIISLLSLKLRSSYHTMIKRYKILSFFQISYLWVWTLSISEPNIWFGIKMYPPGLKQSFLPFPCKASHCGLDITKSKMLSAYVQSAGGAQIL